MASNGKYLERDHVTPLLRDLKWIKFNSILRLNEASFLYKNLYAFSRFNVKKINFDLRNKVLQWMSRNGSDVHIHYRKTAVGQKTVSVYGESCGIRSRLKLKFKYHRYVQKSYVPTPPRAPITLWGQSQSFLIKIGPSSVLSRNLLCTNVVRQIMIRNNNQ